MDRDNFFDRIGSGTYSIVNQYRLLASFGYLRKSFEDIVVGDTIAESRYKVVNCKTTSFVTVSEVLEVIHTPHIIKDSVIGILVDIKKVDSNDTVSSSRHVGWSTVYRREPDFHFPNYVEELS